MALHDLTLSATESNWRLFMVRKADPTFLTFQEKIHARDNYVCQYCGFHAKKHLEVVNLNGNYRDNRADNLRTACSFCAQCFFLEAIGKGEFGSGTLIYLPEMTQGKLNALCHVLFATMLGGSSNATQARTIYRSFKLRGQVIEKKLGEGFSNPALLGRLLVDSRAVNVEKLNAELESKVRLLPDMTSFAVNIVEWIKDGLNELTLDAA